MKTAVCIHGLSRGSSEPAHGAYGEKFKTLSNNKEWVLSFVWK